MQVKINRPIILYMVKKIEKEEAKDGQTRSDICVKWIWSAGWGREAKGTYEKAPSPKSIFALPLPALELAHLVHEGLQARPGVGLFLAVVGQVEEGYVVVALPKEFKQGV